MLASVAALRGGVGTERGGERGGGGGGGGWGRGGGGGGGGGGVRVYTVFKGLQYTKY